MKALIVLTQFFVCRELHEYSVFFTSSFDFSENILKFQGGTVLDRKVRGRVAAG